MNVKRQGDQARKQSEGMTLSAAFLGRLPKSCPLLASLRSPAPAEAGARSRRGRFIVRLTAEEACDLLKLRCVVAPPGVIAVRITVRARAAVDQLAKDLQLTGMHGRVLQDARQQRS